MYMQSFRIYEFYFDKFNLFSNNYSTLETKRSSFNIDKSIIFIYHHTFFMNELRVAEWDMVRIPSVICSECI